MLTFEAYVKKTYIKPMSLDTPVKITHGPNKGKTGKITKIVRNGANYRVTHTDDSSSLYHRDHIKLHEEVPVNNVGDGNIASVGVGVQGEPPAKKTKLLKRKDC